MRHALIGLLISAASFVATPANAAVNVSIGINVPTYPSLVRVPNYPVYYAPSLQANYFFYDGLYWVFGADGTWYESPWYNGPWYAVDPYSVPVYLLRVPVRYYRARPAFFHGWSYDSAPRWGDHWGSGWQSRRSGWDRWDRSSVPAAAPLPNYQRSYSGNRYPVNVAQQAEIQTRSYNYQPRDTVAVQQFKERRTQARTVSASDVTRDRATAQAQRQQQAQERQTRIDQAQVKQQQRERQLEAKQQRSEQRTQSVQQHRAQQEQRVQVQQQRHEAQAQRQQAQRVQQAERQEQRQEQRQERQQQHENRGQGKGKGHDKDNG